MPTFSTILLFSLPLSNSTSFFTFIQRISVRLQHSLSLQRKLNDMNTSSYAREPPSPKRATPQNASVGEKVSHPSDNPQLGRKAKVGPHLLPKRCSRAASKAERERTTNENDWKESTGYERFRSRMRCGALEVERAEDSRKT